MLGGQRLQRAVGQAVVLHKHEVPYLNHLWVVFVYEVFARSFFFFLFGTDVHMYFGTWSAGALVAHFPEVIFFASKQYAVFGNVLFPIFAGFHVFAQTLLFVAAEYGNVQVALVNLQHLGKKFPSPGDGFAFEIVAKTPVAQHLEHCVVVSVVPNLLEVVVLATYAKAFLRVGNTRVLGLCVAQEYILKLVHTGICKHKGGVVLHHHGCRWHDMMSFGFEESQKLLSQFI